MPPTPSTGSTASVKTMMPIPPIHCVMLRQNRIPRGSASMSPRIVAPVVVKPETVSKNASVKPGMAPVSR